MVIRKSNNLVSVVSTALFVGFAVLIGLMLGWEWNYAAPFIGLVAFFLLKSKTKSLGVNDEYWAAGLSAIAALVVFIATFTALAISIATYVLYALVAVVAVFAALTLVGFVLVGIRRFGGWLLGSIWWLVKTFVVWVWKRLGDLVKLVVSIIGLCWKRLSELVNGLGGIIGFVLRWASRIMLTPFSFVMKRAKRNTDWIQNMNKKEEKPTAEMLAAE